MAYGGVPLRQAGNGETVKGKSGNVTANKADKATFESNKGTATTTASGKKAKYLYTQGEVEGKAKVQTQAERIAQGKGGRGGAGYTANDVCSWVSDPNNKNYYGWTGQQAFDAGLIDKSNIATIDGCAKKVQDAAIKEEAIYIDDEGQPVVKTETTEEECVCTDPMTKQETVFPKNADGTCEPCTSYQMEETLQPMETLGMQYLPEDDFTLATALAAKTANTQPIMGKSPGVRENAWGTDYMAQAELMKGMTQGTINAIQKTAANNPAGAIAAMMAAGRGAQGNMIDLASQTNAENATRATALNKANTQHQWNQLLLNKDNSDVYNQRKATRDSNVAQDFNNKWANVAAKNAQREGNARMAAVANEATGMKWDYKTGRRINTNNKKITPEAPAADIKQQVADYAKLGYDKSEALKAIGLDMQAKRLNSSKFGGAAYKKGGFVYADMMYPYIL